MKGNKLMSQVRPIVLTVTCKQAALKDSTPTARLPCNLEKLRTAVEYISSDRDKLSRGWIDRLRLTGRQTEKYCPM